MERRLLLQALLEQLLGPAPEDKIKVYFDPEENITMEYPCITYKWDYAEMTHADNNPYLLHKRYMVTVIDRDPDTAIAPALAKLPLCTFNRSYPMDNLHHFVFNLFF